MNWDSIVSLISSVGFPIVCCLFLWKFIDGTLKDFSNLIQTVVKEIRENNLKTDNALDKFSVIISENTKMLERLCDYMERGDRNNGTNE